MRKRDVLLLAFAATVFVTVGVGLLLGYARAQQPDCVFGAYGCGHMENHHQYKEWHREPTAEQRENGVKGMHCCSDGDCRPTKIRGSREEGYFWWDGEVWVGPVPDYAIIATDKLGDGRAHVCAPPHYAGQAAKDRLTYCLSPSEPRI